MPDVSWDDLLKEADKSDYQPLPDGVYDFIITKAEAAKSQAGNTMYKITSEVENNADYNRRKIWSNLVVTEGSSGALRYFFSKMSAIGLTREYFASNPPSTTVAEALLDRKFRGRLVTTEYNGKERNEIDEFLPASGGSTPPPPPASVSAPSGAIAPPPPIAAEAPIEAAPAAQSTNVPPPPF